MKSNVISLRIKEGALTCKKADLPGDVNVRHSCVGMEGGSAQVPLSCVTVEALTLEKTGDGHNVRCRRRHRLWVWRGY